MSNGSSLSLPELEDRIAIIRELCFVVASAAGQRACSLVCIAHGRIAAIVLMDR
jgi:hypothetical protein